MPTNGNCQGCSGCEASAPVLFTPEMKKTHTILIPTMLPIHFQFMADILEQYGYRTKVLDNVGRGVVDQGLQNVHNDTCYPALLVIGQMLDALKSGEYDPHQVALLITQTGGGCRASNYLYLLRKALAKSGYDYIPVIPLNLSNLFQKGGLEMSIPLLIKIAYAMLLGDLLMLVSNQCRPYELHRGDTERTVQRWRETIQEHFQGHTLVRYASILEFYRGILRDFAAIPRSKEKKIRVGVVGEIYVKFSPLGNNNLEEFLLSEGAEVVMPGLLDFCLYSVYNGIEDYHLYGGKRRKLLTSRIFYDFLLKKQSDVIAVVQEEGSFDPPASFERTRIMASDYINLGVKMGEGWLLTAEMVELIHKGVENIVCTQPFGCLPNHIVGKGMFHAIKRENPQANIVAIDYDPGASQVNQQNRIKLMLANAAVRQKEFQAVLEKAEKERAAQPQLQKDGSQQGQHGQGEGGEKTILV